MTQTAEVIDGNAIAEDLKVEVRTQVAALAARGVRPTVATLLVGDDAGARLYRRQIERVAGDVGAVYRDRFLPAGTPSGDVIEAMRALARDPAVHGIVPLRPLPAEVPEEPVLEALDPTKDLDCLHPLNAGRLALGQPAVYPVTPWACFEVLDRHFIRHGIAPKAGFEGKDLVIIGRSNIVGKPAYFLALERNATTTTVHSFTWRAGTLPSHTRRADILIVAMGKPEFVKADMVKPGAVVVDVGINVVPLLDDRGQPVPDDRGRPRRKTVGDVAFDEVSGVASAITPVPGGVGSVTTVLLMKNLIRACGAV